MSEKADRVLLNGKIVAVDSDFSIHEAISKGGLSLKPPVLLGLDLTPT